MSIEVKIAGNVAGGQRNTAQVTNNGELVVAPMKYDDAMFNLLDTVDTAYVFYDPKPGQRFVITGFTYKADRDVSNTVDATIVIYEASSETSTTVDKTLHEDRLIRGEDKTVTGIRLLVNAGKWVSAKTDDDDIPMTIFGYYIADV